MRLSIEMAMSARSRNSRRIVIIASRHLPSTLPRQPCAPPISSWSDQPDDRDHAPQVHTEILSTLGAGEPCHLENNSHPIIAQLLSPRNYDSLFHESQSNLLSQDRVASKAEKTNKPKKAKHHQIVKKPLHTVLKPIAHKPINSVAHHPIKFIAPLHTPVGPVPAKNTDKPPATVQPVPPNEPAQVLIKSATPAPPANNIPLTQDLPAQTAALPNVQAPQAPVIQPTQPEIPTEQPSPTPQDATPPTPPTPDLPTAQEQSPPVAEAQSSSIQEPTPPTTDSRILAPVSAAAPQGNLQDTNVPASPSADGTSALENANVAIAQQSFPPINTTLNSPTNAASLNSGALLYNGTASINGTSGNLKTNLNGLNSGTTSPNVSVKDSSTNHVGAAVGGVFGSLALIALIAASYIMITRRRRGPKADKGFGAIMDTPPNGSAANEKTMTEVHSGDPPRAPAVNTSFDGLSESADAPMMSPVDPVTRFSLGGFSLLKRLEGLTESLNRSVPSASPDGGSSDDGPTEMMADTPPDANRRPFSSDSQMDTVEPALVSPLLIRTDSDGSDDTPTGPGGDHLESQVLDGANRGSAGTDTSYATGGNTISSGYEETVKFEDGSDAGHEDSAKAGTEQAWWGVQRPAAK